MSVVIKAPLVERHIYTEAFNSSAIARARARVSEAMDSNCITNSTQRQPECLHCDGGNYYQNRRAEFRT